MRTATPDVRQIRWRRTLAVKPTKGAVAMDLRELASAVAERTGLSRGESADIVRAVVEGLSDQLSSGEAEHLAVDLPAPLTFELAARRRQRTEARPVKVDDFVRQISARTAQPERDARAGVGAVLAALRDAMSEENYGHLTGQLPETYSGLVTSVG
jgi:uncharacterized protein (DUF2267 family)